MSQVLLDTLMLSVVIFGLPYFVEEVVNFIKG